MDIKPDPSVMLVVFVVFLITMFFLNSFVFRPLLDFMTQREQKIASDLESANKEDNELKQLEMQIKDVLNKAKMEATTLRDEQIQQAKDNANAKIARIQLENREKMDEFVAKLHQSKEQMKSELKSNCNDISSLIVAKIKNI